MYKMTGQEVIWGPQYVESWLKLIGHINMIKNPLKYSEFLLHL